MISSSANGTSQNGLKVRGATSTLLLKVTREQTRTPGRENIDVRSGVPTEGGEGRVYLRWLQVRDGVIDEGPYSTVGRLFTRLLVNEVLRPSPRRPRPSTPSVTRTATGSGNGSAEAPAQAHALCRGAG